MLDGSNYLKVGIYRATAIDEGGRLWVDDLRVGRTMASVSRPTRSRARPPVKVIPTRRGPSTAADRTDAVTWVAGVLLVAVVLLRWPPVATHRR